MSETAKMPRDAIQQWVDANRENPPTFEAVMFVQVWDWMCAAEAERDSWRDKYATLKPVSDSAFERLSWLQERLRKLERCSFAQEMIIRKELHNWLHPLNIASDFGVGTEKDEGAA